MPKHEAERASRGSSVYRQGYTNGKRAFVLRAQPTLDGLEKSYWVTLDKPSSGKGETKLGAKPTLNEARMAEMFFAKLLPTAITQSVKSRK